MTACGRLTGGAGAVVDRRGSRPFRQCSCSASSRSAQRDHSPVFVSSRSTRLPGQMAAIIAQSAASTCQDRLNCRWLAGRQPPAGWQRAGSSSRRRSNGKIQRTSGRRLVAHPDTWPAQPDAASRRLRIIRDRCSQNCFSHRWSVLSHYRRQLAFYELNRVVTSLAFDPEVDWVAVTGRHAHTPTLIANELLLTVATFQAAPGLPRRPPSTRRLVGCLRRANARAAVDGEINRRPVNGLFDSRQ